MIRKKDNTQSGEPRKGNKNELSPTHERVFRTTAIILERRIIDYFSYLFLSGYADELPGSVRLPFKDDVTQEEKKVLTESLVQLSEMTELFARSFDLDMPVKSLRDHFRAQAFKTWEDLENSYSSKIRGYGNLPPDTDKKLDECIAGLEKINNTIVQLFRDR